jgi:hypothetical protein
MIEVMIRIDSVSMMNDSAKKMNGTNEKCSDILMRVNVIGMIDKRERISVITMR